MDAMAEHLSDAGNRAWRALALTSHLLTAELEAQSQRDAGMPHVYFVVLVALYEAPGRRLRAGTLAETALITPSRLSHAVRSMETSGWVQRERAAGDGRGQDVVLTDSGVDVVRRLAPQQQAGVRVPLLRGFSDAELARLAELLEPVITRLSPSTARVPSRSRPKAASRRSSRSSE
jgi:DNA-binding MarR family transcriptional regulator